MASTSSLMATQAALLCRRPPVASLPTNHHPAALPFSSSYPHTHLSLPKPKLPRFAIPLKWPILASISTLLRNPDFKSENNPNQAPDLLSGSTRTVTTLFAVTLAASKLVAGRLFTLAVQLKEPLLYSAGPAFFAAMKNAPSRSLNTPFTVVAAGMSKWLDLYSGVLMVRVLLSWFPNIPWDRQPLSAIRDLCDPYLNLFRNIIPPIFDTLDVSPLLAFAVLGTLGSILSGRIGEF